MGKFKVMKIGQKIKFKLGNKIRFVMDFRVFEGLPDVEFTICQINDSWVELSADGYGGGIEGRPGAYGSGSIHISIISANLGEVK